MHPQAATLIASIGAIAVAILYLYLHHAERQRYFLFWTVSWAIYGINFAAQTIFFSLGLFSLYTPVNLFLATAAAIPLVRGIALFVDRPHQPLLDWLTIATVVVGTFAWFLDWGRLLMLGPASFMLGVLLLLAGHLILDFRRRISGQIALFTGLVLILRGVLRFLHPFGSPDNWYGAWGYTASWFLDMAIAFGLLVLYFNSLSNRLQESENRFKRLADNAPELVFLLSLEPQIRFVYISPRVQEVLGVETTELAGNAELFSQRTDREDREIWNAILRGSTIPRKPFNFRFRRDDGRVVWLQAMIIPLQAYSGKTIAIEGWIRDIDTLIRHDLEMNARQLELERGNEALQEVNHRLWQFNDAVSNDLRTPLWRINTYSRILEEDYSATLDETARGYIASLRLSSQQVSTFINSLIRLTSRDPLEQGIEFDVSSIAQAWFRAHKAEIDELRLGVAIASGIVVAGDASMLRVFIEDLCNGVLEFCRLTATRSLILEKNPVRDCPGFRIRLTGDNLTVEEAGEILHAQPRDGNDLDKALIRRILAIHGGRLTIEKDEDGLEIAVQLCGRETRTAALHVRIG